VFYYLDQVLRFFRRFLNDEYSVDVTELLRLYVTEEHLATIGLVERDDEIAPLYRLIRLSPEAAVLQAYSVIERKILDNLKDHVAGGIMLVQSAVRKLASRGFVDWQEFNELREMRNRAAHAAHFSDTVPVEAWRATLDGARSNGTRNFVA
jgi:hypothetical protein